MRLKITEMSITCLRPTIERYQFGDVCTFLCFLKPFKYLAVFFLELKHTHPHTCRFHTPDPNTPKRITQRQIPHYAGHTRYHFVTLKLAT